nr:hypothetical protein [Flavobacterium sp. ASV13]
MKLISTSFSKTLKDSDLKDVTKEWSEVFLDSFLEDGVLKDIPLIGTLIGLGKTGIKINDTLFIKKLLYFISQINEIPAEERQKVISEIDDSKKYRIKIGEKLLYIIDRCDDHERAEVVGSLFGSFLSKKINYDQFLRCSLIIEKCMINDLLWFVKTDRKKFNLIYDPELLSWGILEFAPLQSKIVKVQKRAQPGKSEYKLDKNEFKIKISDSGLLLRENLKNYCSKKFDELELNQMNLLQLENYIDSFQNEFKDFQYNYKIEFCTLETIVASCNNWNITDEQFIEISTAMLLVAGKSFIFNVDNEISKINIKLSKEGNDFNFERWSKFYIFFKNKYGI